MLEARNKQVDKYNKLPSHRNEQSLKKVKMERKNNIFYKNKVYFVFPGFIVLVALGFIYLFYEYNRVKKNKRLERREELSQRRQELLDNVIKSKNKRNTPTDTRIENDNEQEKN